MRHPVGAGVMMMDASLPSSGCRRKAVSVPSSHHHLRERRRGILIKVSFSTLSQCKICPITLISGHQLRRIPSQISTTICSFTVLSAKAAEMQTVPSPQPHGPSMHLAYTREAGSRVDIVAQESCLATRCDGVRVVPRIWSS